MLRKNLVSRSCQTEIFVSGDSDEKAYFRLSFEGRSLQFRLPMSSALAVLFSKVPVVGDFVWHGIVLDGSLTPLHYNMLPGEENCSFVQVVVNHRKALTYADEIMANDAVRAVSFRLRLQEEENDALKVEIDELQAQIFSLHRELSSVTELCGKKIEEERIKKDLANDEKTTLQANFRRLEAEFDLLKKRAATREGLMKGTISTLTATPAVSNSATPADWREFVPIKETRSICCVLMDEASNEGTELPPFDVEAPFSIAIALRSLVASQPTTSFPPLEKCMVCLRSRATGNYTVVDLQDQQALLTTLCENDTLYIAKMN